MAKGLPRQLFKAAIAKIKGGADRSAAFKWAWAQHRGGRSAPASSPKKTAKSSHRSSGGRSMAKKGCRRSRGFLNTATIFKLLRFAALGLPAVSIAMQNASPQNKLRQGLMAYTGFNIETGTFSFGSLGHGWMPFIATSLVTKGIQKLMGIIRRV